MTRRDHCNNCYTYVFDDDVMCIECGVSYCSVCNDCVDNCEPVTYISSILAKMSTFNCISAETLETFVKQIQTDEVIKNIISYMPESIQLREIQTYFKMEDDDNDDVSNYDVSNDDVSNDDVSNDDVSNDDISNDDVSNDDVSNDDDDNNDNLVDELDEDNVENYEQNKIIIVKQFINILVKYCNKIIQKKIKNVYIDITTHRENYDGTTYNKYDVRLKANILKYLCNFDFPYVCYECFARAHLPSYADKSTQTDIDEIV